MKLMTAILAAVLMLAPDPETFPIMAWFSVLPPHNTHERYQEMAEAGFNISFSHFESDTDLAKALKEARGTGVRIMATCPQFYSETRKTVERFRKDPMLYGYFLVDEPVCDAFPELKALADSIRSVDDRHVLYLNLLPTYVDPAALHAADYEDYVRRFVREVNLGLVSYDNYPITDQGVRPGFFENLEIVSKVCREEGQPFWAFALSTAHNPYPVPTRGSLRFQIFNDLAYGAQGIQYFTYAHPESDIWNFHHEPLDKDYRRTDVYDLVAELNREVQSLSAVFSGCTVLGVWHTGNEIPSHTRPLGSLPEGICSIEGEDAGFTVSHLRNGEREYVMIVNHDYAGRQKITVATAECVKRIMPDGKAVPAGTYSDTQYVAPGDMLLFRVK